MRSNSSRSASSAVRATASRSSGKRSASASGASSTHSWLPRRSRSAPSSDVRFRIATIASWRSARLRLCAWTLPVTTVCTPIVSASCRSRAFRCASPRSYGTLELDEEPVAAEDRRQLGRPVAVADREPVPRAAGQADEALRCTSRTGAGRGSAGSAPWFRTGSRMRGGQQPAEVRVSARRLDEQGDVRAVRQRDLGPGDRTHAECLRRVRELERSVHPVVIRERERLVAELRRARRELLGMRGAVEERIG